MATGCEQLENAVIIKTDNQLVATHISGFNKACDQAISQQPMAIILDFSKTGFIDSSGLSAVVLKYKKAKANDIETIFCSVTGLVENIFRQTGLDKIYEIFPTLTHACEYLELG